MNKSYEEALKGYQQFRNKFTLGDESIMHKLANDGQKPEIMVVACCDSRVDPALILQCEPGDLFVVRNVANIVPPYEKDEAHHGTSAALEFGICHLKVKHLILLGHSQCGGIQTLINGLEHHNDFIENWVSLVKTPEAKNSNSDEYAKLALRESYKHCLTFPWIKEAIENNLLKVHLWFFNIQTGEISAYSEQNYAFNSLPTL